MNAVRHKPPELLAPAGESEAMRAAVASGADAVYFGLEDFNARRRAENFTLAGLPDTVAWLHAHNVKAYIAFNTLVFPAEIDRALRFVAGIASAGADAIIVQDLGMARLIRRLAPTLAVHASTQMTQTHAEGLAVLRDLGIRRVILSRELSLAEIAGLASDGDMELEVFVHGAMCISFSGQCLASESLFGRSANRGECAQACRLPYELIVDGKVHDLGERAHPLSPLDLATYDRVAELVALGVKALKIEGRLKNAAYVAAVTDIYRTAIDAAVQGKPFRLSGEQQRALDQSFSRGFTHGFLDGNRHQELVDGRSPKNRGVSVGTVVDRTTRGIVVQLNSGPKSGTASAEMLKPGDGVVFSSAETARREQGGRIYAVEPVEPLAPPERAEGRHTRARRHCSPKPQRVELTFGRGDLDLAAVAVGAAVWKTDDPAVRRELERIGRRDDVIRRCPIAVQVTADAECFLSIRAVAEGGCHARVRSPQPLEIARKHPLTTGLLREQLGRLGDTPFELAAVDLAGPDGPTESVPLLAPKSLLNELRRQLVQVLIDGRAAATRHQLDTTEPATMVRSVIDELSSAVASPPEMTADGPWRVHVLARYPQQVESIIECLSGMPLETRGLVYIEFEHLSHCRGAIEQSQRAGIGVALAVPQILRASEQRLLDSMADMAPDAILVRNLAAIRYLRRRYPRLNLIGDQSLQVVNEVTALLLAREGLARLTPGPDLNASQLAALLAAAPEVSFELVVHQHVPMFHMAYCIAAACLSRGDDCESCGRPCERHEIDLRDRTSLDHPVLTDGCGRTTVFNRRPQSGIERAPRLARPNLRDVRIELLRESAEQARGLIDLYTAALAGRMDPGACLREIQRCFPAGVTRGTFDFA